MAPTTVRLVLIEGANADGVIVEQDNFEVAAAGDSATSGAADQVIAAIIGTREGADEWGCQLTSTGVTWTDPAQVAALREELADRDLDLGSVMLVSPLLAAAALAQTVGHAIGYEHIAMLFVEPENATLVVVEVADGSIVDLHRQPLENARQGASQGAIAAELAVMVAGLDVRGSPADGVFIIGCGTDIVSIKPALEAATSLDVTAPEEPDMALARGAALASATAPLFASSTAALAYALDPGTGEVNPRALSPTYLDVCANADLGESVLAYSAVDDDEDDESTQRRRPLALAGSAMAGVAAIAAGLLVVSSDVRPMAAQRPSPPESVVTPASQAPPQAQLPPPSSPPASAPPAAPVAEVAAPPVPPPVVQPPPQTAVNMAPATQLRRAPTRQAPAPVQTPVQQAPPPAAPQTSPPAAVPAPPPEPTPQPTPMMTMYLHVPFLTIPIPIYPPPPPPPPPAPPEPGPAP
jgi:hypothetical protein